MGKGLDNETLATKIKQGEGDRKELLEILWCNNQGLVHKIVHELTGLDSWKASDRENFADMVQQAFIGIMEAVDTFDNSRGIKFFSWAVPYIKKSIYKYHDNGGHRVRLPTYMRHRLKLYVKEKAQLENQRNRTVSRNEVMDKMGLSMVTRKTLNGALQMIDMYSIDEIRSLGDDGAVSLLEMIASEEDIEQDVIDMVYYRELHETMRAALALLPEAERDIIYAIYYQGMSCIHVANLRGCSRQNIHNRLESAYTHLRKGRYRHVLREFL